MNIVMLITQRYEWVEVIVVFVCSLHRHLLPSPPHQVSDAQVGCRYQAADWLRYKSLLHNPAFPGPRFPQPSPNCTKLDPPNGTWQWLKGCLARCVGAGPFFVKLRKAPREKTGQSVEIGWIRVELRRYSDLEDFKGCSQERH